MLTAIPPIACVNESDLIDLRHKAIVGVSFLTSRYRSGYRTVRDLYDRGQLPPALPTISGSRLRWDRSDLVLWERLGRPDREAFVRLKAQQTALVG